MEDETPIDNAATRVRYVAHGDSIRVEFASGVTVQFPRAFLAELTGADDASLKTVRVVANGSAIAWSNLGVSVDVAVLLATIFRSRPGELVRPPRARRPKPAGATSGGGVVKTRKRPTKR